jgi:hypothetical protein
LHNEILANIFNKLVCKHRRAFVNGTYQIDIYHYLNTLHKKPDARHNSAALKQVPKLKSIFDTFYSDKPKKFIKIFIENQHLTVDELVRHFEEETFNLWITTFAHFAET